MLMQFNDSPFHTIHTVELHKPTPNLVIIQNHKDTTRSKQTENTNKIKQLIVEIDKT